MAIARVPQGFRLPTGEGAGPSAPTFTAPESIQRADLFTLNPILQDEESRADLFLLNPVLAEMLQRGDDFLLPTIAITPPETIQRSDPGTMTVGPTTAQARAGGKRVIDSSGNGHTGILVGAPTLSAGSSGFGNRINTSDGNYISATPSVDFDFNRSDMTIECRIKTASTVGVFMGVWTDSGVVITASSQWVIGITSSGTALFGYIDGGGSIQTLISATTFNNDVEHVLRITKNGTALTLLVDGSSVDTDTVSSVQAMPSVPLTVGDTSGTFVAGSGAFDEIRLSNVVRSDATTSPFANDANTLLLYHFEDDWTADGDDWGDAWTNNTIGQTGVNHGNETPLALAVGVAGVGVNLGWVKINLKRFTGFTATGNSHTITGVFTNNSAIVAATITLRGGASALGGGATSPFTESTLTQANQPATPTDFVVTANLAAAATNATLTFTLTDAQMNTILGKWATLRFESSGGTTAAPDVMVSREGAAANRMTLTFTVQI